MAISLLHDYNQFTMKMSIVNGLVLFFLALSCRPSSTTPPPSSPSSDTTTLQRTLESHFRDNAACTATLMLARLGHVRTKIMSGQTSSAPLLSSGQAFPSSSIIFQKIVVGSPGAATIAANTAGIADIPIHIFVLDKDRETSFQITIRAVFCTASIIPKLRCTGTGIWQSKSSLPSAPGLCLTDCGGERARILKCSNGAP